MRIDGKSQVPGASYAALGRRIGGPSSFVPDAEATSVRAAATGPVGATTDINALLALQSVDDALFAKKKAVRRGQQLLDTLDDVKADLLAGRVSEGRLNQLLSLVGQARERTLPGLDSLLDDVELRARVELAKFGRFAAA